MTAPLLTHGAKAARPDVRREVKFLPQPIEQLAEDGLFEGYASLFGVADLGKDVVAPGRLFGKPKAPRGRRRAHAVAA